MPLGTSRTAIDTRKIYSTEHLGKDHLHLQPRQGIADTAAIAAPERHEFIRGILTIQEALRSKQMWIRVDLRVAMNQIGTR